MRAHLGAEEGLSPSPTWPRTLGPPPCPLSLREGRGTRPGTKKSMRAMAESGFLLLSAWTLLPKAGPGPIFWMGNFCLRMW